MTRREFEENVNDWESLIEYASEIECDACDELVLGSDLSGRIGDDFHDYAYDYDWTDIKDWLNRIQDGSECYEREGSFEYCSLDNDDFDRYKDDVAEYADRYDYWDYDEEEEEDDEFEEDDECEDEDDFLDDDEEDDAEVPEEDFSVSALFTFCNEKMIAVKDEAEAEEQAEEEALTSFICSC